MIHQTNIINTVMLNNPDFIKGIEGLYKNKPKREVYIKAAEEMNELATKLLQCAIKPSKVGDGDILEEVVDVQMHLILLMQYHPDPEVIEWWSNRKIDKFVNSSNYKEHVLQQLEIKVCECTEPLKSNENNRYCLKCRGVITKS